jgi:3-dehydroquinate synthase
LEGLREFREHLGGALSVTLLTDIGSGVEVHDMDPGLIESSIAWLESHQG